MSSSTDARHFLSLHPDIGRGGQYRVLGVGKSTDGPEFVPSTTHIGSSFCELLTNGLLDVQFLHRLMRQVIFTLTILYFNLICITSKKRNILIRVINFIQFVMSSPISSFFFQPTFRGWDLIGNNRKTTDNKSCRQILIHKYYKMYYL